ncbi:MAG TPA: NAD-dependent epimerase/dehydratase family protein [Acidobacteriota bacterium]|nr:NAD-dependent epimerase/dehydratase family protein [Acidobacteriota bacterium]
MNVLVTGGAGFIGGHIAEALLDAGHQVSIVDDLSSGFRENIPAGARFYQIDIRAASLAEVFKNELPEVVCHQAAKANVRESLEVPVLYADVNILGSLNLLECCRKFGTRKVLFASTGGAVYGEPEFLPVTEDHPVHPLDPYGASKHALEHYLYLYRANFGLEYTILRYPNVYGPRQNPFGEAGVVAIFANQILHGDAPPTINGTGEQERDFVFVSDVVQANLLALNRGDGGIFNIGSGVGTSVNRIFQLLAQFAGYPYSPRYGEPKQGEVSKISLDGRRALEQLGWSPRVSLEDGLQLTLDYFRKANRQSRPLSVNCTN